MISSATSIAALAWTPALAAFFPSPGHAAAWGVLISGFLQYFLLAGDLARHGGLPRFAGLTDAEVLAQPFSLTDAQAVIAAEQGFSNWAALKNWSPVESRGKPGSSWGNSSSEYGMSGVRTAWANTSSPVAATCTPAAG